ncbi:MAG: 6,7-dimethyl-8-ribityllumazine synthase [Microbacteriaceae bacterium]
MSRAGSPALAGNAHVEDGTGLNVVVVAGRWHDTIAQGLLDGATRVLEASGASYRVIRVPGSFELPVASKAALEAGADAVVALGVIIRGGTPHFQFISEAATSGLTQVSILTGKPVGFGVLTLDDEKQGLDRAGLPDSKEDKGAEAASAALAMAHVVRELRAGS